MYKGILDTSVIVRFLSGDAPDKKKRFRSLIESAAKEKSLLFVPLIVVIELVYVLEKVYRLNKHETRERVESMLSLPSIQLEGEELVLESLRLYAEGNVKFGDAMILAKSRISGILPIYTFDKKDFGKFPDAEIL